jgi:integral membrane protein (TIGR01906 family)
MRKNREEKILPAASAILAVYLVFSLSFFLVFINKGFYDKSFSKNGAYQSLGVDGVRSIVDSLIKYLISDKANIHTSSGLSVFTPNELSHLSDVHNIFIWAKYLSIGSAIAFIFILFRFMAQGNLKKKLENTALYGAIGATIALAIIFLLSLNFEWMFNGFHHIFFPNGNFEFPADSLLITLFPPRFFVSFFRKVLLNVLIITIILYFPGTKSVWQKITFKRKKQMN